MLCVWWCVGCVCVRVLCVCDVSGVCVWRCVLCEWVSVRVCV